jgi:hypothetical protein
LVSKIGQLVIQFSDNPFDHFWCRQLSGVIFTQATSSCRHSPADKQPPVLLLTLQSDTFGGMTLIMLLGYLAAVALATKPITLTNVLDALSVEGLQQYNALSLQQQEAAIAKLQAMSFDLQDAKCVRFSSKGKVRS